jgi:hypothetical protein
MKPKVRPAKKKKEQEEVVTILLTGDGSGHPTHPRLVIVPVFG